MNEFAFVSENAISDSNLITKTLSGFTYSVVCLDGRKRHWLNSSEGSSAHFKY
jgi:hypothetical protein